MFDRGIEAYPITVHSLRWYMRIVFWVLNAVVWNLYRIAMWHIDRDKKAAKRGRRSAPSDFESFARHSGSDCSHRLFVLALGKELICDARANALSTGCKKDRFFMPLRTTNFPPDWGYRTCDSPACQGACDVPPVERAEPGPKPLVHIYASMQEDSPRQCAGCSAIKQELPAADAKSFRVRKTRRGCLLCKVHLCDFCVLSVWDHAANSIFRVVPDPYGSWEEFVLGEMEED